MKFKITDNNRETANFFTAVIMIAIGSFACLYAEIFIEPFGEISGSVLGFTGECFSLAGALFGMWNWVNTRLNNIEKKAKQE